MQKYERVPFTSRQYIEMAHNSDTILLEGTLTLNIKKRPPEGMGMIDENEEIAGGRDNSERIVKNAPIVGDVEIDAYTDSRIKSGHRVNGHTRRTDPFGKSLRRGPPHGHHIIPASQSSENSGQTSLINEQGVDTNHTGNRRGTVVDHKSPKVFLPLWTNFRGIKDSVRILRKQSRFREIRRRYTRNPRRDDLAPILYF